MLQSISRSRGFLFGLVMILTGLVLVWSRQANEKLFSPLDSTLKEMVTLSSGERLDPSLNGKPVMVTAKLFGTQPINDSFIKDDGFVYLRREVEMYQWLEDLGSDEKGGVQYRLGWFPGQVDFFSFREPAEHENPLMKIAPLDQKAGEIRFGVYKAESILKNIGVFPVLPLGVDTLRDPTLTVLDNKLVVKRDPGSLLNKKAELGDMRITYRGLSSGIYTVLGLQTEDGGLEPGTVVGGGSFFVVRPGEAKLDELLESLGNRSREASYKVLLIGVLLIFFGFLSLLAPFSERIDLKPYVNLEGFWALLTLSLGLSLLLVLATALVGMF